MEEKQDLRDEQERDEPTFVPASFEKRVAAWVGVAYMVMLLFVITFSLYSAGRGLPGTFPLLLVPVSVGLEIILIRRLRQKTAPGGVVGGVLGLIACAAGLIIGVGLGGPALVAALFG